MARGRQSRLQRMLLFSFLAGAIYITLYNLHESHPIGRVSWAILTDLIVTVPALFYFLVVRPLGWPVISTLPLLLIGLRSAPVPHAAWVAAPIELALVAFALHRIRRLPKSSDVLQQLRAVTFQLIRNKHIAQVVAAELAVFYYAFFPKPRQDPDALPYIQSTAASQFAPVILFMLILETAGLHLILMHWSHTAAWWVTAADIYGLAFAIGFYRSLGALPHLLSAESLTLRMGLLSELRVERSQIASWSRPGPLINAKAPGTWRSLSLAESPQFVLEFTGPINAVNLYGFHCPVKRAAIAADRPELLSEWLTKPVSS